MYYFDQKTLQQYLNQRVELKIFADDQWFDITNQNDLSDPVDGIGYDVYGQDHRFDYRDITQIKVGSRTFTLDQLQTHMTGKEEEKPKPKSSDEEEPPKEKEPELAHYDPFMIGRQIVKEFRRTKKRG